MSNDTLCIVDRISDTEWVAIGVREDGSEVKIATCRSQSWATRKAEKWAVENRLASHDGGKEKP